MSDKKPTELHVLRITRDDAVLLIEALNDVVMENQGTENSEYAKNVDKLIGRIQEEIQY